MKFRKTYDRIHTHNDRVDVPYRVHLSDNCYVDFTEVLNHPRFMAMRGRKQLSDVDQVIEGGSHTRRAHCLGVLYLEQRVIVQPYVRLKDVEKFLVLGKSVLHDLGHGPDSHVWENFAVAYGLPGHKERCIQIIEGELAEFIDRAARDPSGKPYFPRTDVVGELVREMKNETPLSSIVSDRVLGLDRLDYVYRDCHNCNIGTKPDVETILTNLVFDGQNFGVRFRARDAVHQHMEALIAANREIYLSGDVETYEGFKLRAICHAIDDANFGRGPFKLNPTEAYDFTDEQLNQRLMADPKSREIVETLRTTPIDNWRPVGFVKLEPYGKVAHQEVPEAVVVEVPLEELRTLTEKVNLQHCISIERELTEKLNLGPTDVVVTSSPQIDRLDLGDPQLLVVEEGKEVFRGMSHFDGAFMSSVGSRLHDHYSIRVVASEKAWQKVRDYIGNQEGLKRLLVEGQLQAA